MVYDDVTVLNKAVRLKALTKGRFFSEGGKLVNLYIDGKLIGTNLSGGDGYAFFKYTPLSKGTKTLRVEKEGEEDEGALLVTGSNDRVFLVAIEGALFESIFSLKPAKGGKNALEEISKNYSIVYLTNFLGINKSRKWLKDNEFPVSPVFKWEGPETITGLTERGINLHAIVGSPEMLTEAEEIKQRYSFRDAEDATEIKDWDDLLKQLK